MKDLVQNTLNALIVFYSGLALTYVSDDFSDLMQSFLGRLVFIYAVAYTGSQSKFISAVITLVVLTLIYILPLPLTLAYPIDDDTIIQVPVSGQVANSQVATQSSSTGDGDVNSPPQVQGLMSDQVYTAATIDN